MRRTRFARWGTGCGRVPVAPDRGPREGPAGPRFARSRTGPVADLAAGPVSPRTASPRGRFVRRRDARWSCPVGRFRARAPPSASAGGTVTWPGTRARAVRRGPRGAAPAATPALGTPAAAGTTLRRGGATVPAVVRPGRRRSPGPGPPSGCSPAPPCRAVRRRRGERHGGCRGRRRRGGTRERSPAETDPAAERRRGARDPGRSRAREPSRDDLGGPGTGSRKRGRGVKVVHAGAGRQGRSGPRSSVATSSPRWFWAAVG